MYLGEIVELGESESVFATPHHPYTQALLSATPTPNMTEKRDRIVLQGKVPSLSNPPIGCRFHTRCPHSVPPCETQSPPTYEHAEGWARCHLLDGVEPHVA